MKSFKDLKASLKPLLGQNCGRSITIFPDDQFIVSYPKSGNTWVRFLVANLLTETELVTFANIDKIIPDIYKHYDRELLSFKSPRILKSHEYFDPKYDKVIYIVRDPRDVVVSYYHYDLKIGRIFNNYSLEQYVSKFIEGKLDSFGTWKENVGSWLGAKGKNDDSFLILKYEDIVNNTEHELKNIGKFIRIKPDEEKIKKAVQQSSPNRMRQLEQKQSEIWKTTRGSQKNKLFVRAAKSGSWKEELHECLSKQIEDTWGDLMIELGYLIY